MQPDPELIQEFVAQSLEHLEDAESLVLEMEKSGVAGDDALNEVFRATHSIKGAAGFLGLEGIQELSHALEELLMKLRDGELSFRPDMADPLLAGFDGLRRLLRTLPDSGELDRELITRLARLESGGDGVLDDACDAQRRKGHHLMIVPLPGRKRDRERFLRKVARFGEVVREGYPEPRRALVGSPLEPDLFAEAVDVAIDVLEPDTDDAASEVDAVDSSSAGEKRSETVRVSVSLLDKLMNLAGELVLGRNRMRQLLDGVDVPGIKVALQNVNLITTELQESIMSTRMQPIRVLFDRLPRLVRDLSQRLERQVDVELIGGDVELDRSIIEALADPLTHVLRNSVDHGIESPEGRRLVGKPECGRVVVRAYHERGRVVIDIRDDGQGIDPEVVRGAAVSAGVLSREAAAALSDRDALALIFEAGLTTASEVTDVSGRGVGMDVVRTNVESLGGQVELDSVLGLGTTLRIHLPLTLAIVPSLIVSLQNDRFAIPQANLVEVVSLRDGGHAVENIRGSEVLRLRGSLLPLVRLSRCLGMEADRRLEEANVAVLRSGTHHYGLVVDELHDTEEIVVKPLSAYLADCDWYAGATILGDGRVAMILDTGGIARGAALRFEELRESSPTDTELEPAATQRPLVLFEGASGENFALPLDELLRLEYVSAADVEYVGTREFLQVRGRSLPLVRLEQVLPIRSTDPSATHFFVLIPRVEGFEAGIVASRILDTLESDAVPDPAPISAPGLLGSAIVRDRLTLFLDAASLLQAAGVERSA